MVVADQHEIDARQILEADARRGDPARPEAERSGALTPDRIGEDVETLRLDQHGRVADPCHQHPRPVDARRRPGGGDRDAVGPGGAVVAAGQLPPQEPAAATAGRWPSGVVAIGIEEARAVVVIARWTFVIEAIEEARDDRDCKADRDDEQQECGE